MRVRDYALVGLALLTGFLHLAAAFDRQLFHEGALIPDPLFALNGLGFIGLLGAYFVPLDMLRRRRNVLWWAFFLYICVTIVAWVVIWIGFNVIRDGVPFFHRDSLYGVPSKVAEVILLILLWRDKPMASARQDLNSN